MRFWVWPCGLCCCVSDGGYFFLNGGGSVDIDQIKFVNQKMHKALNLGMAVRRMIVESGFVEDQITLMNSEFREACQITLAMVKEAQ